MSQLHNTGHPIIDMIYVIASFAIMALAWFSKGIIAFFTPLFLNFLNITLPEMSLSGFNEGLHTIVMILAGIASITTIFFAVRNNIRKKKQ